MENNNEDLQRVIKDFDEILQQYSLMNQFIILASIEELHMKRVETEVGIKCLLE